MEKDQYRGHERVGQNLDIGSGAFTSGDAGRGDCKLRFYIVLYLQVGQHLSVSFQSTLNGLTFVTEVPPRKNTPRRTKNILHGCKA